MLFVKIMSLSTNSLAQIARALTHTPLFVVSSVLCKFLSSVVPCGGPKEVAAADSELAFADVALTDGKTRARTSLNFLCWLRNHVTEPEAQQRTQHGRSRNHQRE